MWAGIGFANVLLVKCISIFRTLVLLLTVVLSRSVFSQEPQYRDSWPIPNQFEKPKLEILKYKKEFLFKFDDTTFNTFVSLTYEDKKICDQKTKEWQNTRGTKLKDKEENLNNFDASIFTRSYPCEFVTENVASRLIEQADQQDLDDVSKINFLIAFVNSIPYEKEKENMDYWKTPYETLRDGTGDCEDASFLLSELISQAKFDSILVNYSGHMNVCANPGKNAETYGMAGWQHNGINFYYCEPTPAKGDGEGTDGQCWVLGQYPNFVKKLGPATSTHLVPGRTVINPIDRYKSDYEKERVNQ